MPRYVTHTAAVTKPQHTKAYSFALNSLSSEATQIENTFSLGQTVNVRKIVLNAVNYPYDAPGIRYCDEKCMLFAADSYATVPYTTLFRSS